MIEYSYLLGEYSSASYSLYANSNSLENWGNMEIAEQYLKKYWLPEHEYLAKWKTLQDRIFINQTNGLPEIIYPSTFEMLALRGGILFTQEDFEQLQSCVKSLGDNNIVIVQNTFGEKTVIPPFKMIYPSNISWAEVMSGNFISTVLFEMFANEYFVFSESANWGKYAANDYEKPLDIIGFKHEYATIFKEQFKQQEAERQEIKDWLPPIYKELLK